MKTLTEEERWIVINGLHTAASKYERLADQARERASPGWERLAEQFDRQTKQVTEMAELVENAGDIQLTEYKPE